MCPGRLWTRALANGDIIVRSLWALTRNPGGQDGAAGGLEATSGIGSISAPRWHMSPMVGLLIAWGILTAILIILLIYRSTLTMHEDDQIFLNESESHMEKEQVEILAKVNKITPIVKVLGAISG